MTNDPASMSATVIDPATKEWIQLALDALTAFGTVGAVIVALWLAGRGRVEIIRGRAGERLIIQMGMRADEGTPIINIEVTNLTHRPVTISNIGWSVGIFRRQHFVQIPDYRDPLTFRLPTNLDYGERANYNFPREEFLLNNASAMYSQISTIWPWLSERFIFLEVFTSGVRVTSDSVLSARWQSLWRSVQKPSSRDQAPNEYDASLLVYISRGWLLRVVETERLHLVLRRARD